MSDYDPREVMHLVTAPSLPQAHIWEEALRDAGVPCEVVGGYFHTGLRNTPGVQLELWVQRCHLTNAREILALPEATASEPEGQG
jgi:hypothetical protein